MPSFIDKYLNELGGGLDEKAVTSLKELDAVCALSILHRLNVDLDKVRNQSAFVATSVKTAVKEGGHAGPKELENVIRRLREDGTLDENAEAVLHKVMPYDACHALSGFLIQDETAVRNASAYVTRNVINARNQTGAGSPHIGAGSPHISANYGYGIGSGRFSSLLAKWRPHLDQKALTALMGVGRFATEEILAEMDSKHESGNPVRNPSAYVQRAIDNPKPMPVTKAAPYGGDPLLARWGPVLDQKATDALISVGRQAAAEILGEMDSKHQATGSIRNPSAYVQRACEKRPAVPIGVNGRDHGRKDYSELAGKLCAAGFPGKGGIFVAGGLDESAKSLLRSVSEEERHRILGELEAKGSAVRNPSAFVQRAVANAKRAGDPGNTKASASAEDVVETFQVGSGEMHVTLDADAKAALDEIGEEATGAILQELLAKGDKVRNPSAYVLKAVGNARKGRGAGGLAITGEGHSGSVAEQEGAADLSAAVDLEEKLAQLSMPPDEKARAALDEVHPSAALTIIEAMNRQQVNNTSAYIMKAIANEHKKRGIGGPPAKRARLG